MSDGIEQRDQLDRPGIDPGGPLPAAADREVRQLGQDARGPDPGDVVRETGNPLGDPATAPEWDAASTTAPIGVDRVEFYRQVNRAERVANESAQKGADDVIAAIGGGFLYAGLAMVLKLARRKTGR